MRPRALLAASALVAVSTVAGGGCGDDDGPSADPAAFCARLERLTTNDPFLAFGETATAAEIESAFTALVERARELVAVAPPEIRGAARDYADAAARLDEILDAAGYVATGVDTRAYRNEQVAYVEAADRLLRHLDSEC